MKSYSITVRNNEIELEHYSLEANNLDEAIKIAEEKYDASPIVEINGQSIKGKIIISVYGEDGSSDTEFDI